MRIVLKTLKQIEYELLIESNNITVKDLKLEIERLYSFDSEQLKLISQGTVLDNSKKLSNYNIEENSTIIIMNIKIKKIENFNQNNSNNINKNNIEMRQEQKKENISQILKDNLQITIDSLIDMGYEKSQVEIAVKAANGRIDLAVEYLNNGIPDNVIKKNYENNYINRINNNENEITKELKKQAGIIKALCKNNKYFIFIVLENIKKNDPGLLRLITDYREEFRKYLDTPLTEEEEKIYQNIEKKVDNIITKRLEQKEKKIKEEENKKNKEENKEQNNKEDIKDNNDEKDKDNNNDKIIKDNEENKKNNIDNKEIKNKETVENDKKEENIEKKDEIDDKVKENKQDEDINKSNNNNNANNLQEKLTEEDKQIINRLQEISGFSYDKVFEAFIVCNKNEELTANYLFEQFK